MSAGFWFRSSFRQDLFEISMPSKLMVAHLLFFLVSPLYDAFAPQAPFYCGWNGFACFGVASIDVGVKRFLINEFMLMKCYSQIIGFDVLRFHFYVPFYNSKEKSENKISAIVLF